MTGAATQQSDKLNYISSELRNVKSMISERKTELKKKHPRL